MAQSPYTIDLLQFIDGNSTQLVPPVQLEPGKYTQIRLGVIAGTLVTAEEEEGVPLEVPSEYLKTDKNFDFHVDSGEAVDLMVDFDLSQSIKPKQDGYQLKPVLHLNETQRAAQIRGSIAASTFVDSEAEVTVTHDGEEYTKLLVTRTDDVDPTEFSIFWLVPDNEYTVEVDGTIHYEEEVASADLEPGEVHTLNLGEAI
jgi:hemin uptake protein HemP